jgi:hypothetical protein
MEFRRNEYRTAAFCFRSSLEVWESGANDIRWASDHGLLEQMFVGEVERFVRNDSTVQWRSIFYEAPPYLRRTQVKLRYSMLDPARVSLIDANVEIPLRPVNPVANAHRSRCVSNPAVAPNKPKTGLNAPDLMLENMIHPNPKQEGDDNE